MRFLTPLLALAAFSLLPGSASAQSVNGEQLAPGGYRWVEEGQFEGPLYLIISLRQQMIHVYNGDRLVGMASVSTGTSRHRTPTGEFSILQKREWHRSNLYSNAPMPFMQRLTWDGVALHAGHNPGYPASHGCIRLPNGFARKLFGLTQLGTLVRVNADALGPALMLDQLVLSDPGTAVVTFTPDAGPVPMLPTLELAEKDAPVKRERVQTAAPNAPVKKATVQLAAQDSPSLAIDPSIFRPRLRR